MKITKDDRIANIIKKYPGLIDVLVNYNPHFKLLKNPILRRTVAKLATVEKAAQVAGVSLRGLLKVLNSAAGYELTHEELRSIPETKRGPDRMPDVVKNAMPEDIVTLDVRPMLRSGEEPFGKIMETVKNLKEDQIFFLEVLFEPGPLYDVMEKKGFCSYTEKVDEEHFRVYFYRKGKVRENKEEESVNLEDRKRIEDKKIILNVRGLEPPQPMELVLKTLEELKEDQVLIVEHERKPMFLLPRLEERGFKYEIEEKAAGNVIITIKKPH
jgi:uncharacterized protein (DUF2249 family)